MNVADAKHDVLPQLRQVKAFPASQGAFAKFRHGRGFGLAGIGSRFRTVLMQALLLSAEPLSLAGGGEARFLGNSCCV
jgi:hypothetical protein